MANMSAMQFSTEGGSLEMVQRPVPTPGPGEVLVKVEACGVCHSDHFAQVGGFPGMSWPRIPGHEIAGSVAGLGQGVEGWQVDQRVGVGWFGGNCARCQACRRGNLINCENMPIPGVSADGGYAEYVAVSARALAAIPEGMSAVDAAPLMCAGITTFNALRHSGAGPGDLVAILGVGGLGHLGVQFASAFGYDTVAIARGTQKEELARKLGARHYIDSSATDPGTELAKLGGAKVVLATVTNSQAMNAVMGGLAPRGRLVVVGASMEPIMAIPAMMIGGSTSIAGHASGTSIDSEDTLAFAALAGVKPMIETVPLAEAGKAFDKMMSGEARYRMVLTI